jgi:hypothetical protein
MARISEVYRLTQLKDALKLEIAGMRKPGTSVNSRVKNELGFTGTPLRVLEQLETHIYKLQQREIPFGN